ncbi:MAG: glycoside hydrolase family 16 protein [Oscillospiraceae bacterium]|nr:glycoside hydrolase family 16 protein [Oscillospiraceae bacterium]
MIIDQKELIAAVLAFLAGMHSSVESMHEQEYIMIDGKLCTMTFEDNFDGTELDETKWERCPEWKRQDLDNYWDNDMSCLDGKGNLVISMEYDKASDAFLSGAVRSRGKFEQTYGYYEIRCTLNSIPGYWTAFWLMGESVADESEGGVNGTEIDIYESAYYTEGEIQHTINWDGYGTAHKSEGKRVNAPVYDKQYHTFSLLWTEEEYVYYIDGKETWRTSAEKAQGVCTVPLYMKITSETGSWTGIPDKKRLPDSIKVDYVRVWQLV